ncbi:MAG TPA: OmpH family outer membrane protein [Candidatus Aquilonibacter sp.]
MKRQVILTLAALIALLPVVGPAAIAADLTDVGFLDQSAVASLPAFVAANQQVAQYKAQLEGQFASAMRGAHSDADKQRITLQYQQEFQDKQNELMGPLFQRAQAAIAAVSAQKKLSIVVDKRIVIYGGQDITSDVVNQVRSSSAIDAPPANPASSSIGFVDQSALANSQEVKSASAQLQKFQATQQPIYQARFKNARTDVDKQQVMADYNKAIQDKQSELLKPLIDQTRNATASVARSKNLLLVVDRADVVFGGTDITQDVQNSLNK